MLNMLLHHRRTLRGFACAVTIALCCGPVLAGQHLHETGVPEEICALCGLFDSGLAPVCGETGGRGCPSALAGYDPLPATPLVSRPFETRHSRAPPTS